MLRKQAAEQVLGQTRAKEVMKGWLIKVIHNVIPDSHILHKLLFIQIYELFKIISVTIRVLFVLEASSLLDKEPVCILFNTPYDYFIIAVPRNLVSC